MIFLLVESMWFWIFAISFFGALVICEAFESGVASIVVFVAGIILVHFCGINVFSLIRDNYVLVVESILGYLALGVIWSGFKWYLKVVDDAEAFQKTKDDFYIHKGWGRENKEGIQLDQAWKNKVKDELSSKYPPKVKANKAAITRWMSCWVASLFWTLCHDFLTGLYRRLVQLVSGTFQKISNKVFSKFKADFE